MENRAAVIARIVLLVAVFVLTCLSASFGQGDTPTQAIGLPAHGFFSGSNFDTVQVNNGNLHIEISLYSVPGRGLSVPVSLVYDSKGWYEYTLNAAQGTPVYVRTRGTSNGSAATPQSMAWIVVGPLTMSNEGWNGFNTGSPPGIGIGSSAKLNNCVGGGQAYLYTTSYREPNGTSHSFPAHGAPGNACGYYAPSYELSSDGAGYTLTLDSSGGWTGLFTKSGTHLYRTVDQSGNVNALVMEDRNGNQLIRSVASNVASTWVTDTLGRSIGVVPILNNSTGKYELKYNDSDGNQQTIQFTMTTVNVHTNLCPAQNTGSDGPCNEWVGSWQAPSVIQLPNGMQYVINYVQNSDGQISSIQLPTGATISYTWGPPDDAGPKIASRTVTADGQAIWSYAYSGLLCGVGNGTCTGTVTDPNGNDAVHTFQHWVDGIGLSFPSYEVLEQDYQGSASNNVLLKTIQTARETTLPHLPLSVTTTWNQQGGLVSRVETDYDSQGVNPGDNSVPSWGNVTEKREFGFTGQTPARTTDYQYAHISGNTGYNVNYPNLGIADLVTQKTVWDGSSQTGTKVADAKTVYDGAAPQTTTGVPNHDYTIGTYRGNATQSSVWLDTTGTWLPTNNTYNDLGHVLSTTDPGNHTTTFSYSDSWVTGAATCGVGTNTQAYLTQTQAPDTVNSQGATVHHRSQSSYYPCTGQKGSARDENDILAGRTGTQYSYKDPVTGLDDPLLRLKQVLRKDNGGQITSETDYTYTDTANSVSVTTTVKQDSSHNIVSTSYQDGLGRVKQTQLVDPSDGDTFVDTTYDLPGRVASVSNPHHAPPHTLPTDGITAYQYDALGRKILEIPPDGTANSNNVQTAYGAQTSGAIGLTTTVTDQAGHKRMSVTDALGRLVDVWEPDPSTGSLVNETLYSYNARDNLLQVDQKGGTQSGGTCLAPNNSWRTRTFSYDSLSRLLTACNPEAGTITWTYDSDSNVLTKKDARNVTITYNYDQLHRVATTGSTHAKTYSNGDTAVDYYFDQTSYNGLTITEGVNHRTGMKDMTGAAAWTFDSEGRTLKEKRKVNISGLTPSAVNKTLTYTYNLDSSMQSLTYPSGDRVDYLYNTAGHALSAIDSTGSTPIKYVTSATYAPHGDVAGYVNGLTSSFTGITTTNTWNNRFQPQTFTAATQGTGGNTVMSLSFNFNQGTPSAPINNGLLMKINNGVNSGRNVNYKYDQLNRIVAGWHDATDWGTEYAVDNWGNLTQKGPCDNVVCPTHTWSESLTTTANANNQLVGYPYDASGNLTNDELGHTFNYDGENRPYSTGGVTYYYDGEGERVAKSSGKLYLFGTGSAPVVETDVNGTVTAEYVFFNGKRVAMRKADNSVHYYFADQIGSANVVTDASGDMPPEQDIEYHPYGEQQVYIDTLGQQYKFTGKEHDAETGNDYFGARYYSSAMGRFLTPDWAATPVPIPYAVMGNPQTLNLYSYVENNPITGTDPDGHYACPGKAEKNCADDASEDRAHAQGMMEEAWAHLLALGNQTSGISKDTPMPGENRPLTSVTVLGQTVSITYSAKLTERQQLVDGMRIAAGAELINKNASKLSADEVKAIKEITSINVPAGKAQLGLTGSHEATFSDHYLSGVKSAAWMGSMFAHEGQHRLQVGVYLGANLWMDEQKASRVQLGVGVKLGMSRDEQRWLRKYSADSNKADLQLHMTGGYTD